MTEDSERSDSKRNSVSFFAFGMLDKKANLLALVLILFLPLLWVPRNYVIPTASVIVTVVGAVILIEVHRIMSDLLELEKVHAEQEVRRMRHLLSLSFSIILNRRLNDLGLQLRGRDYEALEAKKRAIERTLEVEPQDLSLQDG